MNEREQKLIEEWLHTNPHIALGEYCLQKGREEMQKFVEDKCRELGIDYIQIFTCEGK